MSPPRASALGTKQLPKGNTNGFVVNNSCNSPRGALGSRTLLQCQAAYLGSNPSLGPKSIDGRLTPSNASISAHDVPTSSSLITLAAGSVPMARPGTEYPGSDLKVTEFVTNVATHMRANAVTRVRHTTLPKRRRFGHTAPGRSRSSHPSSECK